MDRPDWLPTTRVEASIHIYPTTRLVHRVHTDESRAVIRLDGTGGEITIFADRDDLARLRDLLADVVTTLDHTRTATDGNPSTAA